MAWGSLAKPGNLEKMLAYLTAEPSEQTDEAKRLKYVSVFVSKDCLTLRIKRYSYLSIEVFSCEIFALCDALIHNAGALLVEFWSFLDRPSPLNDLQASYFARVNAILLSKNTVDVIYLYLLHSTVYSFNALLCIRRCSHSSSPNQMPSLDF